MKKSTAVPPTFHDKLDNILEVLKVALKLGVTSFGGPIAHLGYFHNEYVKKRKWLDDKTYTDLVALCQFLPGPASSELGIGIGTIRAGFWGGLAAWLGFTLPSAILLAAFAFLLQDYRFAGASWLHGLKIVAVAIVAQAVLSLWQKLVTDRKLATITLCSMVLLLLWQTAITQVAVIVLAGCIGFLLYKKVRPVESAKLQIGVSKKTGAICIAAFFILLIAFPLLRQSSGRLSVSVADSFYRSGALVFGGGHVVLPLLANEVVPSGWVTRETFLAGYGAAQAVPGPLFTFSAFLGEIIGGIPGAILCLCAIFLPAFLLIYGALPFWNQLRKNSAIGGALIGINAAVVGILLAALYTPLCTSAILSPWDLGLSVVLFGLLVYWELPPWVIVIAGVAGSMLAGAAGV